MNATFQDVIFDPQLIRRYDVNGPRYTSYPTADRFVEAFDADAYRLWLGKRTVGGISRPLSLYVHIPFCNTICYYCACNKIITKDHGRSAKYLKYLGKELALQSGFLDGSHDVVQLHWGGGTPTFLSHDEMRQLMASIRSHFRLLPNGEYSIEVDPRKVDEATVALLGELGFNRMSLGVQDFDPAVQEAVNRVQSIEETETVLRAARENGFKSISVDLIYGLPKQNVISFNRTLEEVIRLSPDRLSIYNYAHLPSLFKPQRRIHESELPSADAKLQILQLAIRRLTEAGYVYIGMDHFAKPDDELAVAQRQGRLHRNFQGYSTQAECDLLAFGVSAIGKIGPVYAQNVKTLDEYYDILDRGELPVLRGIELTADDLLRRAIIQSLMCNFELSMAAIEIAHLIDFREYFASELEDLHAMA
ncbi:MAG: oxygen-independent coproporphyrinogen III oxidase, partial [Rhodocyclaceae bacterium]|nr:oxygen-independent coproporphyrinogen III oxidase [Rhodocyclaceae bacterium]